MTALSKRPSFSARTDWDPRPNKLAQALEAARRRGAAVLDLTESNPTRCGLLAEDDRILKALARAEALRYEPDPRGLASARRAVAGIYASRGVAIPEERILLTSSTSEAYAHLFRLLANPGDEVLVPAPSYPLFDLLARLNDVRLVPYPLVEAQGFGIDLARLEEEARRERARAVLAVSPGNPTGAFMKRAEREALASLCAERGLALVVDEVFGDFHAGAGGDPDRVITTAGETRALTFILDGISKMLALPQMKIGWIAASGPEEILPEALSRLEVIADTYLSVATPAQAALPDLLALRDPIQRRIRARLDANLRTLGALLAPPHPASLLAPEGGWSAVLRVPGPRGDEEWALALLAKDGVLVHPGYFFDFPGEGRLVVSLLPEEGLFREAASRIAARVAAEA